MQREADRFGPKQLFTTLTERIPQMVWTSRDDGQWTWSNPRWTAYTGLSAEASLGDGWYLAVDPLDRAATLAAWQKATDCGVLDVEHRLTSVGCPHETRWFATCAEPLPGVDGQERSWLGTSTDIHETRLLEERHRRLLDATQQRVFNVMSLTRSVARRTAKASASLDDFTLHLDSRLDAIARTQTMLGRDPETGTELGQFVADELRAHAAHEGEQVHVSGPLVSLKGQAAGLLSLAIHELAMNAVEHGALSMQQGHIAVTWGIEKAEDGFVLRFEWLETGVVVSSASPRRQGFGTDLIEHTLKQQLGATATLGFGRDGVCCTITLPVAADGSLLDLRPRG